VLVEAKGMHPGLAYCPGPGGQEGSLIDSAQLTVLHAQPIVVTFTQLFPLPVYSTKSSAKEKLTVCTLGVDFTAFLRCA